MSNTKLGCIKSKKDTRTLKLSKYLLQDLPLPPTEIDWLKTRKENWPLFDNDKIGDCTCASAGHSIINWRDDSGKLIKEPTTDEIIAAYSAITGYNPSTGDNDNGAMEIDVLKYWKNTGISDSKIGAFTSVDHTHVLDVARTIELFGSIYVGINLPLSAQNQEIWDTVFFLNPKGRVGSWGGHAICIAAYKLSDNKKSFEWLDCITWGARKRMTGRFFKKYCMEAWAIFTEDWINKDYKTPEGIDVTILKEDLSKLND